MLKLIAHFQIGPQAGASIEADNYADFFGAIQTLQREFGVAPKQPTDDSEPTKTQTESAPTGEAAPQTTQRRTRSAGKGAQAGNAAQPADTQKTAETPAASTQPVTNAKPKDGKKVTIDDVTKALVGFANKHSAAGLTASRELVKQLGVARMGELSEDRFQEALDLIAAKDAELSAPANSGKPESAEDLI